MIIAVLATSTTAEAQDQSKCPEVLDKCDKALNDCTAAIDAKNQEIAVCRLALDQSLDRTVHLVMDLDDANRKLSSPFRNPYLMIGAGAAIGALATKNPKAALGAAAGLTVLVIAF